AVEPDAAAVRPHQPEHDPEQRTLARAVRPRHRGDRPGLELQVDALQYLQAAVPLVHALEPDHDVSSRVNARIAGVRSTSVSGVSTGSMRSAASRSGTNGLRSSASAGSLRSTSNENSRTGWCGTSPVPSRSRS